MANRRIARLNEQIKRELTDILHAQVRDPRVGHVTITEVRATPDLYSARVFVTSLASEEEKSSALEGLRAASSYMRGELGRRMHVRRVPDLTFQWDETLEHAQRIEQLLREVRPADDDAAAESAGEENGAG